MYLGILFSQFLINFLFLKILAFLAQKTEILAKKWFFGFFGQKSQRFSFRVNVNCIRFSKQTCDMDKWLSDSQYL